MATRLATPPWEQLAAYSPDLTGWDGLYLGNAVEHVMTMTGRAVCPRWARFLLVFPLWIIERT